jgi:hypothetical protein
MNTTSDSLPSWLLQLPDPCLEAVMCCCASDPRSLFSAARAHSRLHQAAVLAASSIQADVSDKRHVNSVVRYLTNHGQHVHSAAMHSVGEIVSLSRLPHSKLQGLSSLRFRDMRLQLGPGNGWPGVLDSWALLKQLQLHDNVMLDGEQGLQRALVLLPLLQHLSLHKNWCKKGNALALPNSVLQGLQQLTFLELQYHRVQDPDGTQHLQQLGLTRLQHLGLDWVCVQTIPASALLGLQRLTFLKVARQYDSSPLDPDALAGKTLLQHLEWVDAHTASAAGVAQLLSHLQSLQQLTYLDLSGSMRGEEASPPAAAYAALTASSKLQHLDVSRNSLPTGVWQHVFPAGRQGAATPADAQSR